MLKPVLWNLKPSPSINFSLPFISSNSFTVIQKTQVSTNQIKDFSKSWKSLETKTTCGLLSTFNLKSKIKIEFEPNHHFRFTVFNSTTILCYSVTFLHDQIAAWLGSRTFTLLQQSCKTWKTIIKQTVNVDKNAILIFHGVRKFFLTRTQKTCAVEGLHKKCL